MTRSSLAQSDTRASSNFDTGARAIAPRSLIVLGAVIAAVILVLRGYRDRGPAAFQPPTIHINKTTSLPWAPDAVFLLVSDPDKFRSALPESVQVSKLSPNRWRWNLPLPGGRVHAFGTSLVDARPPYHLRWRTSHRATLPHEVSIDIFPNEEDSGSTLRIVWSLSPPFRLPLAPFPRQIERAADSLLERVVGRFAGEYATNNEDLSVPKPTVADQSVL